MEIKISGKLLHVFDASTQRDSNRFAIQILDTPKRGDTSQKAELHTYKLPKQTNPNFLNNSIDKEVEVYLTIWNSDGRQGFYIREVSDIRLQTASVAKAS